VIEDEIGSETPHVLRDYTTEEDLKDNIDIGSGDRTWYITMNLTQPPFDDIHVRKAVNLVMNKKGLQLAWGGETAGPIATHIIPDPILNDVLAGYDPYATPNFEGDVEAAKAEMAQSAYDSDQDGVCDDPVCKDIIHVTGDAATRVQMIPVIEESLGKIGITLKSRSNANAYTIIQTVNNNIAISGQPGWGKDYADASTFAVLFDSRSTIPEGNINYSLVGLTSEQAADLPGLTGTIEGIPSVDADNDACNALPAGDERVACWAAVDQKLMEEVVPWVPYLWSSVIHVTSDAVLNHQIDQFSTSIAYAHVAVDQSKQQQ
jgi:peptide/nickel transport system substrate-binding protein